MTVYGQGVYGQGVYGQGTYRHQPGLSDRAVGPMAVEGRYLTSEGQPFMWQGDTAWDLGRLTPSEANEYLSKRASQGFTIVQGVVFNAPGNRDNIVENNAGQAPFAVRDGKYDFDSPNDAYFDNFKEIVEIANEYGLYVAVLPLWGGFKTGIYGGRSIAHMTDAQADGYGRYIGAKLKDNNNVIWIIGGDTPPGSSENFFNSLASAIDSESDGIMTYHNSREEETGRGSWQYSGIADQSWYDFHGYHTTVKKDPRTYVLTTEGYQQGQGKPVVSLEEDYFGYNNAKENVFQHYFAGGAGITHGWRYVWDFDQDRWQDTLEDENVAMIVNHHEVLRKINWASIQPDQSIIESGEGEPDSDEQKIAEMTRDGESLVVYVPEGNSAASIRLSKLNSRRAALTWHNPDSATTQSAGTVAAEASMGFTLPSGWSHGVLEAKAVDDKPWWLIIFAPIPLILVALRFYFKSA
ncbi:MAG: DUF4038 domain-containing protein [Cyanobacteria bacterium P01_A01_bin.17]